MASTATTTKESYNIYIKGKGKAKTFPLIFQKFSPAAKASGKSQKAVEHFLYTIFQSLLQFLLLNLSLNLRFTKNIRIFAPC